MIYLGKYWSDIRAVKLSDGFLSEILDIEGERL